MIVCLFCLILYPLSSMFPCLSDCFFSSISSSPPHLFLFPLSPSCCRLTFFFVSCLFFLCCRPGQGLEVFTRECERQRKISPLRLLWLPAPPPPLCPLYFLAIPLCRDSPPLALPPPPFVCLVLYTLPLPCHLIVLIIPLLSHFLVPFVYFPLQSLLSSIVHRLSFL